MDQRKPKAIWQFRAERRRNAKNYRQLSWSKIKPAAARPAAEKLEHLG